MKLKENLTISKLKETIQEHSLKIVNEATVLFWNQLNYQLISIERNTKKTYVLVDDEYEDAKTNNAAILLNLLIYEFQDYLEADDYLVWCKEKGLSAENSQVRAHYFNLKENEAFLSALLEGIEPISPMEWELNSGEAQLLRDEND